MASTTNSPLRAAALIALPIGAVGSVGFMLHTGRRNPSWLLLLLFTLWVLSPFALLIVANLMIPARKALHALTLLLTPASLVIYAMVAFGPRGPKPAFVFVLLPPASWLLIAIVIAISHATRATPRPGGSDTIATNYRR